MKVYYKAPTEDVLIVKTDPNAFEYEFWVVKPVRVGGAKKIGTQRIVTEDGEVVPNLTDAALHSLQSAGEAELARKLAGGEDRIKKVSGWDIVKQDKWAKFCQIRKMDIRAGMDRQYTLTDDEFKELGLREVQ